jgi:NAD-dependent SIR2 family protein deacetylase
MAARIAINAREIAELIRNQQLSILVGSGVSCACGLPSWDTLIKEMKKDLLKHCVKEKTKELRQFFAASDATKIAGLFKRDRGDVAYTQFLRSQFRHCPYRPSPILSMVSKLPVATIFTTNFDKLLETASRDTPGSSDPIVVIEPSQLPALTNGERKIIKIHGDIDHPRSLVLTDEDYLNYDDKYESMRLYFQGHMAFSAMLLVGFGLRDDNFDRIYTGARRVVQGLGPRVIALMSGQNSYDRDRWQRTGLTINDFDRYDEIPEFLQKVIRYSNGK